jgi:hypothetical protein
LYEEKKMSVYFENTNNRTLSLARYLLPVVALLLALACTPAKSHAQITGNIEANIPFQFHVGDVKLPAGKYLIRVLDDSELTVMEISSVDGSISALFDVNAIQASSRPAKTELIFNKYGNSYYLAKLFDEGNADGSRVLASRYEKRVSKATVATEEHVAASHQKQQGD